MSHRPVSIPDDPVPVPRQDEPATLGPFPVQAPPALDGSLNAPFLDGLRGSWHGRTFIIESYSNTGGCLGPVNLLKWKHEGITGK